MRKVKKALVFAFMLILVAVSLLQFKLTLAESASQIAPPENFGPYTVGWIDTSIPTEGEMLPVSLYYPSIVTGEGSYPNTTDAPYPTLLFSLGYRSTIENYRIFAFKIATWGFILVIVGSESESWDIQRATDLVDTLSWLDEQNDNSSFKLSKIMDESKFGVSGHSLGAEAALMLSISESRLKAVIPIAPFIFPPYTFISPESAKDIHIPMLILVGSADTTSPPNMMAYPLYENGNPSKFCLTIMGSDHFNIIFTCHKYIVSFLKFYFYEDQEYARYLYGRDAQQESLDGKIELKYDLRKTFEYEVFFKGISYNINIYSDSTFSNFFFNESLIEMNFTLTGPPYTTGTANVSIPKQPVEGYTVEVYFDEESYPFTLANNSEFCFVYLGYNHSLHQLTIKFVDLTPPLLSIFAPKANSIWKSSNVIVAWSSEDAESGLDYFEAKVDEEMWFKVENAMAYVFEDLSDGDHTISVRVLDNAGNSEEVSVSFQVDTTPPSVSIFLPAACSIVNSPNVTVIWNGSDSVSGMGHYELKLDGDSWINLGTNESYNFVDLADGNHMLRVKAVDKAGNVFETLVNFNVSTKSNTASVWMQWWFWTIICATISFSAFAVFYLRKKSKFE